MSSLSKNPVRRGFVKLANFRAVGPPRVSRSHGQNIQDCIQTTWTRHGETAHRMTRLDADLAAEIRALQEKNVARKVALLEKLRKEDWVQFGRLMREWQRGMSGEGEFEGWERDLGMFAMTGMLKVRVVGIDVLRDLRKELARLQGKGDAESVD